MLLLLFGILLLAGCATHQQTQDKLYPDVKVSRLLRVIDGDAFACDIDEHSAIAERIPPFVSGESTLPNCEAKTRKSACLPSSKNNVFQTY